MTEWLTRRTKRSTIDWLTDSKSKKIDYWLNVDWFRRTRKSTIDCHSRKLTIRQVKIKCNHRSQRRNLFIHANSRSFSLTHVVSWRFVLLLHSRKFVLWFRDFFRENFRFVDLKVLYVNFIQFTKIRFVVSWSLSKKIFWRFYLITRVFRRAIFAEFDRIIVNFVNSVREICCVRDSESSSLRIEKISCWKCAIVTKLTTILFFFTRWSSE